MRSHRPNFGGMKRSVLLGGQKFSGQGNNPLLNNLTKREIQDSISKFMSGDSKFNNAIRSHLFQRLKYATGKLLDSIQWKVNVDVDGIASDFAVRIGVYLTDPKLIDALLSGAELERYGTKRVPSVSELVDYINAKRSYYTEMINERFKPTLHETRRRMKPKKMPAFRDSPVLTIAEEIRTAMQKRVQNKLPPTQGSDYALVGWWKIIHKDEDGNVKSFWKPKYQLFDTPLYTLKSDTGEINIAIKECLARYFDKMFDPRFGKAMVESMKGKTFLEMLGEMLPQIVTDRNLNNQLTDATQRIFDLIDTLQQKVKHEGQHKWAFNRLYTAQMNIQALKIRRMSRAHVGNQGHIDIETKKMVAEIEKYTLNTRKRYARRSKKKM